MELPNEVILIITHYCDIYTQSMLNLTCKMLYNEICDNINEIKYLSEIDVGMTGDIGLINTKIKHGMFHSGILIGAIISKKYKAIIHISKLTRVLYHHMICACYYDDMKALLILNMFQSPYGFAMMSLDNFKRATIIHFKRYKSNINFNLIENITEHHELINLYEIHGYNVKSMRLYVNYDYLYVLRSDSMRFELNYYRFICQHTIINEIEKVIYEYGANTAKRFILEYGTFKCIKHFRYIMDYNKADYEYMRRKRRDYAYKYIDQVCDII